MDAETKKIIEIFREISAVPRRSKHEEKISRWLLEWASKLKLKAMADSAGNVLIDVPASPGRERAPGVVLQGHMDMVCEKVQGSGHDFTADPIETVIEGDWMRARETSLGADNGIALAYGLAIAQRPDLIHPPLELLFTVDEETGLNGAKALGTDFVKGRILLNLDSEGEGIFTIGCAGGRDTILAYELAHTPVGDGASGIEITVGGVSGGHSGGDIHLHKANALKLLARLLTRVIRESGARLVSISGGSAPNAIPRDARAVIAVRQSDAGKVTGAVAELESVFKTEYAGADGALYVKTAAVSLDGETAFEDGFTRDLIRVLRLIPSGLREFSVLMPGLVETSSNLAIIRKIDGRLEVISSQRSSIASRLEEISGEVEMAGELTGAAVRSENSYPAWQPDSSSELLARSKRVYQKLFGQDPQIEAIHGGLECAVIGSVYDGMDMISFGPTIEHPHSPDERLHLPSVGKTWKLLVALLESFE
ncbi:MAG: beta-Ala-His dipeptidase [Spirochaetales bacterium]|nr:beta-Ala-His dipeptidase [Spirochaetales bacterium]